MEILKDFFGIIEWAQLKDTTSLNPAGEPSQQAQLLSTTDYCGNYVLRNDTLERVMHQNRLWQMAILS